MIVDESVHLLEEAERILDQIDQSNFPPPLALRIKYFLDSVDAYIKQTVHSPAQGES